VKVFWQTKKLGEVATLQRGFDLPTQDRVSGDVPLVTSSGVTDTHNTSAVRGPGVATGRSGSIGNVFFIEEDFWPLNTVLYVKDFHGNDPRFVFYLLKKFDLKRFATGSGVPTLNRNFVHDELVNVPPLQEQRRIVGLLDEAFEGIATAKDNVEKSLQNARAIFESHLQSVFTRGGKGWVERRLGEIFEIGSSKRILEADWTRSGVPFYGGKEIVKLAKCGSAVSNAYISEEKYLDYASKYDMPRKGDILITARGTIGVGYVVKEGDKFYYKDGNIISFREKTPTNPFLILYAFRSKALVEQFDDLAGATVKHLPIEKAKDLIIRLPSFAAQQSVVEHLENIETETQLLASVYERKLIALEALEQSVLREALSGGLSSTSMAEAAE
jgi:type I restriction enzyme, S subunit